MHRPSVNTLTRKFSKTMQHQQQLLRGFGAKNLNFADKNWKKMDVQALYKFATHLDMVGIMSVLNYIYKRKRNRAIMLMLRGSLV